jgi:hypothetical protein
MSKIFEGVNITEVWDFRLSSAVPVIDRRSGTWVVHIYSKVNEDNVQAVPLESYDTKIKVVDGDTFNNENLKVCYEWLYGVRDKYSLPDIEERKELVLAINEANKKLAQISIKRAKLEGSK